MSLPRGDEYYRAIQNQSNFNDVDLKVCHVARNNLGLPKPYSGGFTTTYHLYNNTQSWAVRCFTRDIQDIQHRYIAIGRFLEKNPKDIFIKAMYLQQGIRVSGNWHPIIKMQWLDGEPLNVFIDKNISNITTITKMQSEFYNIVLLLEQLGIAHGDLQHGNILIQNGRCYLIDYDGFFIPEFSGLKANEIGHVNYQHPLRNSSHFYAKLDRFSSIVIYLGLTAISISPTLWQKYDNGDNILFRGNDFIDIENSALLSDLSSFPQLSPMVERLKGICRLEFDKIPTLDQFIAGNFAYPKITAVIKTVNQLRNQYAIIDAAQTALLSQYIGHKVKVIGFIANYHEGIDRNNQRYVFLNFGVYPPKPFYLVLWFKTLDALKQHGINPNDFDHKWVSVIGSIGSYNNIPQMEIEYHSQIEVLSGENEARRWLSNAPQSIKPTINQSKPSFSNYSPKIGIDTISRSEADKLNQLYKDRKTVPVSKTYPPATHIPTPPLPRVNRGPGMTRAKKESNIFHGVLGSIVLGWIGFAILGYLGLLAGIVIGYEIGKKK